MKASCTPEVREKIGLAHRGRKDTHQAIQNKIIAQRSHDLYEKQKSANIDIIAQDYVTNCYKENVKLSGKRLRFMKGEIDYAKAWSSAKKVDIPKCKHCSINDVLFNRKKREFTLMCSEACRRSMLSESNTVNNAARNKSRKHQRRQL